MPDIGDFKDVAVIELLVKVGDTIKLEQSLFTVESDKASMEIPSPAAGVVKELKVKIGDTVNIGDLVAILEGSTAAAPTAAPAAAAPVDRPAAQAEPDSRTPATLPSEEAAPQTGAAPAPAAAASQRESDLCLRAASRGTAAAAQARSGRNVGR